MFLQFIGCLKMINDLKEKNTLILNPSEFLKYIKSKNKMFHLYKNAFILDMILNVINSIKIISYF